MLKQRLFLALICRKHPVNIALSNRILQKIDQEVTRQKRTRGEWVELHFEVCSSNNKTVFGKKVIFGFELIALDIQRLRCAAFSGLQR